VEEGFVTDADIDSILAMGEKKTKDLQSAINAKIGIGADGAGGAGLLDFKIDSTSFQTFEGVDYRDAAERRGQLEKAARDIRLAIAQSSAEAMGDRAAKRTVLSYNEQAVLKALGEEAAGGGGGASAKSRESKEAARLRALLPPAHRPPRLEPWHFCDRRRIQEITAMEIARIVEARERAKASGGSGGGGGSSAISSAAASGGGAGERAEEDPAAAAAATAGASGALPESGAASTDAAAPASSAASEPQAPQAVPQQQPAGPFPQELIEERQALLEAGFPHWKRAHFDAFVAANAR
jgi:hypothetical protein